MSLKQELRELKQKRREELRTLHLTYVRTKRDIKRAVSPDRMIRKHMGASLAIAALLGVMLAPRTGGQKKKEGGEGSRVGKWMRKLGRMFMPGKAGMAEEAPTEAEAEMPAVEETGKPRKKSQSFLAKIIADVLVVLLSQVDLQKMMGDLMGKVMGKTRGHAGNGHHPPEVTVADAGTVQEDPFGDFQ